MTTGESFWEGAGPVMRRNLLIDCGLVSEKYVDLWTGFEFQELPSHLQEEIDGIVNDDISGMVDELGDET